MENPLDGPWPSAAVTGEGVLAGRILLNYVVWGNEVFRPDSGTRSQATTGQFRTAASRGEIVVWMRAPRRVSAANMQTSKGLRHLRANARIGV